LKNVKIIKNGMKNIGMSKLKLEDYCTKKHKINISNVFKNYIKNLYITSYI
jgi:hypothetical protein